MNRAFSKILILVILIILIAGGFFAWQYFRVPGEEVKDETANWKTYESVDYGFRLKYPEEWMVGRQIDEKRKEENLAKCQERSEPLTIDHIVFSNEDPNKINIPKSAVLTITIACSKTELPIFRGSDSLLTKGEDFIGGVKAGWVDQYEYNNLSIESAYPLLREYRLNHKGIYYAIDTMIFAGDISLQERKELINTFSPILKNILSTLKFN